MNAKAQENMEALSRNPYPGRGIVIGMDNDGQNMVQVYWIMGRSENSRNRVFSAEGGRLFTEAADPTKVRDPSLIIYNAMKEGRGYFVVSNGAQTDGVLAGAIDGRDFESSLAEYQYEPDAPNFTPRITGVCYLAMWAIFGLAVLRKSLWDDTCDRSFYIYEKIGDGLGLCVTTYSGDGNPLPSFTGDPLLMPLSGNMTDVAEAYWEALNGANRVALAVKFISLSNGRSEIKIINKFSKV